MKTKVLYIVSALRSCGPVNQLLGIVSNLDNDQFDYKVLTLSPEPQNSRMEDFKKAGINIDSLNLSRLQFAVKGKKEVKNYIEEEKPDVIHTTGVRVDTTIANLGYGNKQVMSIRNYAYEDYVAKFGKIVGTVFAKNTLAAIEKAKHPVCCSYSLKEMYEKHVNSSLNVIQNGVDTVKYSPLDEQESVHELRKRLSLPEDKKILLAIGSLIKRKNPITIIEAFQNAERNNAILVLLGEGNLKEECEKKADDSVLLLGNVPNVVDYLRASDLYVSASFSEGLPNSVLEAGRTNIPLILSDIPQHREVFMHGYEFNQFFKPDDKDALTELINVALDSEGNSKALADYIESHFSNESMSEKYQEIYLK